MVNKIFYTTFLFSFVMLLLWITACEKEYSYEGGNTSRQDGRNVNVIEGLFKIKLI